MRLGSDPEGFFLTRAGQARSAHRVFPRVGKHDGHLMGDGGRISRDGAVFELNPTATRCRETAYYNTAQLLRRVRAAGRDYDYKVALVPAIKLSQKELKALPEEARYFGCEASLNAYTGETTQIDIDDPATHPYRYAGGHMHISFASSPTDQASNDKLVKLWDLFLGVPLTYLFDSPETFLRRRYYGQAGDYRPQKYNDQYGLEYRVPGPELFANSVSFSLAFGVLRLCVSDKARLYPYLKGVDSARIQEAINLGQNIPDLLEYIDSIGWMTSWYTSRVLADLKKWLRTHRKNNPAWFGIESWARQKAREK